MGLDYRVTRFYMSNIYTHGAIEGFGERDWVAGANSPVRRKVLIDNGNWKSVSIPHEIQFVNSGSLNAYDSLMCVSYNGTTDAIEYIMMQQIRLGMIPKKKLRWLIDNGYFIDGVLNFSERYTGVIGETTNVGAYVYKVADGMRLSGLIPQKMFEMADNFKDNIDKRFITKEMLALGKEFAEMFKINFEWVNDSFTAEFMKYSPLACTGFFANMTSEQPISPEFGGLHSMLQISETPEHREIDDSYWQHFKKYTKDHLHNFMAFYVDASETNMFDSREFVKDNDTAIIRNSNTGEFGVIYQGTPMRVTEERAGLFMIDRDTRKLIGKGDGPVLLNNDEWKSLKIKVNF